MHTVHHVTYKTSLKPCNTMTKLLKLPFYVTAIQQNMHQKWCFKHMTGRAVQMMNVDTVSNLGVRFDSNLAFLDHMNEKVNKDNGILGVIKRNYIPYAVCVMHI